MNTPRYLIDTNILVYSLDEDEPDKQARAQRVLERVGRAGSGALPTQVLAEFANVAFYRLEPPLEAQDVYRQIERYEHAFATLPLTPGVVLEAVRGMRDHSFSYFDAQIWAVAKLEQVPIVLSEDFASGSTVEGVSFLNPFDEEVALDTL